MSGDNKTHQVAINYENYNVEPDVQWQALLTLADQDALDVAPALGLVKQEPNIPEGHLRGSDRRASSHKLRTTNATRRPL